MEPESAWHVALEQLQMPKATFGKWVGDTQLVRWECHPDAALFVVACPDSLTRDWPTERLTNTLIRILVGVYNCEVKVKFVLAEDRTT
jgi:hypothetical protein